MYIERTLGPFLGKASAQFPVMLVGGPRQVGKTTILQYLSQGNRTYVTLDDPTLAALARDEPALFLQRFEPPVLIDEIQYAPELLPHIKMRVDRARKPGLYWLTGSQQFQLMKGVSESLAGRVGIVNLLGLSLKELQGKAAAATPFLPTAAELHKRLKASAPLSLQDVYRIIWRGAFPAIALDDAMDRDLFYSSYVQTYLQRDVRDLANVGDESAFLKFLRATAARTGQLLNMSDVARDAGIAVTTAKRWLSILEASGIIYLLEPYHSNATKRLVKAPKLYFLDTGLCAYLTEWSSAKTLEAGAMSGAILETFIFTEILKSYWHNGKRAPLYYYRDKDKKEIDLLIVRDETIYPLEFKKTAAPGKDSLRQFKTLGQLRKPIAEGGVICLAETLLPLAKDLNAIPVGLL
ncbi:MAG: ATPase [Proteobacteria bacterium]|nr:MAG: ATPase [Pseudomonadota bacterium]